MVVHLTQRFPDLTPEQIVLQMVPPPMFHAASFDTYKPSPQEPSQKVAVEQSQQFVHDINAAQNRKFRLFGKKKRQTGSGLYLDGGFGVGKTHLLVSMYNAVDGSKAFGSFGDYTQLIGALTFSTTIELLSKYTLLCIDEFELDDPGDTMQMSRLLSEISQHGVSIATTSNTLPGKLGESRFAAKDFMREIQAISSIFTTIRIDGPDYRHRELPPAPEPCTTSEVKAWVQDNNTASIDDMFELLKHLSRLHQSKYKKLVEGISLVGITDTYQLDDQSDALRLVAFIDRLYDADIPLINSGCKLDVIFSEEMLNGGYRKKYLRAISRMLALSRMARQP